MTAFMAGGAGTGSRSDDIKSDVDGGLKFLEEIGATHVLDGNHEDFDLLSDLAEIYFGDPTKKIAAIHEWNPHNAPVPLSPQLSYLPRSSTWEWDGVKFLALGGAVSVDRSRRVKHVSWWPQETIKTWDVHRSLQRPKVDVMLTHDFPQGVPTMMDAMRDGPWHLNAKLEGESATNRIYVETVREYHQPKMLFHGHMHHDYEDMWKGTKVRGLNCNGSGKRSWFIFDTEEFHQGILR